MVGFSDPRAKSPARLRALIFTTPTYSPGSSAKGNWAFPDAYLEGGWSTPDLRSFMDLVHLGTETVYDDFTGAFLVRAYERLRFWLHRNNRSQAKKNISYHYDLGNAFYALWLDETMTYSSAIFETGQESLEKAQTAKYASLVDEMGAKPAITSWKSGVAGAGSPNTPRANATCGLRALQSAKSS